MGGWHRTRAAFLHAPGASVLCDGSPLSRLQSFEGALALGSERLRGLLVEGDSRERVWAAWALGLRVGGAFSAEASAQSRLEPDPGVRRHLVVLLAGLSEGAAIQ